MNADKINQLIDWLKAPPLPIGYDQGEWIGHPTTEIDDLLAAPEPNLCGTHACLAGHLAIMDGTPLGDLADWSGSQFMDSGQAALDLPRTEALYLFQGDPLRCDPETGGIIEPTRETAIACLEILRDTGQVDWIEAGKRSGQLDRHGEPRV